MSKEFSVEDGVRTLRLDAPTGTLMDHVLVTLVGDGPYILIDTGYRQRSELTLSWLKKQCGDGLEILLLTHHHPDHLGGAEDIVAQTGVAAYAHPVEMALMKERAPSLSPAPLEDGETVQADGIELTAVLTPGHSPGHLAFWWEERGILFGGDNVLMPNTTWVGPPLGNLRVYLETLQKIRDLAPRVIFPGHGPPVTDPEERIEALVRHRDRRDGQILAALSDGLDTPEKIAGRIYRGLGEKVLRFGSTMIVAHLQKMAEEGRVALEGDRYTLVD